MAYQEATKAIGQSLEIICTAMAVKIRFGLSKWEVERIIIARDFNLRAQANLLLMSFQESPTEVDGVHKGEFKTKSNWTDVMQLESQR